jgi:hypothetical protein
MMERPSRVDAEAGPCVMLRNFPLPAQSIVTAAIAPSALLMVVIVDDVTSLPVGEHSFG